MDSIIMMSIGYIGWCCVAFVVARFFQIESSDKKGISLLYVLLAAPMVIIEILTGKGSFR